MNQVVIIAKRWFERVNGNTYHSCKVYVNGDLVGHVPYTYGYGNHWDQTALDILHKAGFYASEECYATNGARVAGDKCIVELSDVKRKKDLA